MNKREEELFMQHIKQVSSKENCIASKQELEIYARLCNGFTGDQRVLLDVYLDLYNERQNEIAKEMFFRGLKEGS